MAIMAKRPLASSALSFRVLRKKQKSIKQLNTMSKLTHAPRHEKIIINIHYIKNVQSCMQYHVMTVVM